MYSCVPNRLCYGGKGVVAPQSRVCDSNQTKDLMSMRGLHQP